LCYNCILLDECHSCSNRDSNKITPLKVVPVFGTGKK